MSNSFAKAAIPYAEALFESSKSMQLVEETRKDLNIILTTIQESKSLKSFLVNPLVVMTAKKNILKSLFVDQIGHHVLNFLFILIERRRIDLFNAIVDCYSDLVNKLDLITSITVYTVIPLNNEQEQSLKNKLKMITNSQIVQLKTDIRTDLIGGFIVEIGSKVIDMSIYGQLNQISSYLNGVYK